MSCYKQPNTVEQSAVWHQQRRFVLVAQPTNLTLLTSLKIYFSVTPFKKKISMLLNDSRLIASKHSDSKVGQTRIFLLFVLSSEYMSLRYFVFNSCWYLSLRFFSVKRNYKKK